LQQVPLSAPHAVQYLSVMIAAAWIFGVIMPVVE
jgi:hypothetical protein